MSKSWCTTQYRVCLLNLVAVITAADAIQQHQVAADDILFSDSLCTDPQTWSIVSTLFPEVRGEVHMPHPKPFII